MSRVLEAGVSGVCRRGGVGVTVPLEAQAQAAIATFRDVVDRHIGALALALERLVSGVNLAADALAVQLRAAAVEAERVSVDAPSPTVVASKRTPARLVALERLWAVKPPLPRSTIATELSKIKPGADMSPNDVGVWASALGLPRRDGVPGGATLPPLPSSVLPPAVPVQEPRVESPPVPSGTAVQPVERTAEPESRAAAPMPPEPPVVPVATSLPASGSMAAAFAELFPSFSGAFRPGVAPAPAPSAPTVAASPKPNYPKISGSSIAAPRRPVQAPARPMPALPDDPIKADETYIRSWAAQRGIPQGRQLDMLQINAKARSLGLRPFADPRARKLDRPGARS